MSRKNVIIIGAAGRDFHNFNVHYRESPEYNVVAYCNPDPRYSRQEVPPELAGELYPEGIPIFDQGELERLIRTYDVDECILSLAISAMQQSWA